MKIATLCLLLLSLVLPTTRAQKKDDLPGKLPDMIARALDTNPDIHVVRAKLAEVQAELRRLELRVTRDVVALNSTRLARLEAIQSVGDELARKKKMYKQGTAPESAVAAIRLRHIEARGALQEVEAELHYLCGVGIEGRNETPKPQEAPQPSTRPARPARMAELLRRPATIDLQEVSFSDMIRAVSELATFTILIDDELRDIYDGQLYSLTIKGTTSVEGILTAVHDLFPECVFVLRDYGALATSLSRARYIRAATLPMVATGW